MAWFKKKKKKNTNAKHKERKTKIEKELEAKERQIEEEIEKKLKEKTANNLVISSKELTERRIKKGKTHAISLVQKGKSFEVKRLKVGVKGFDELIEGGIPEKSLVLVSGASGTGKSIFGMNYLVHGALQGEAGAYISLEESPETMLNSMKLFGWPLDELIEKKSY